MKMDLREIIYDDGRWMELVKIHAHPGIEP
jgi:hypothetical protein